MLQRQKEIGHFQAKVGECHFCRKETAELWYEPSEVFRPYQVICRSCGARGPWCDCGWESAVPAWDMVGPREGSTPVWRGPFSLAMEAEEASQGKEGESHGA